MVEVPSGVFVTVSQERNGVVSGKCASKNTGEYNNDERNERTSIALRCLTVAMRVYVSMHEPGTKTDEQPSECETIYASMSEEEDFGSEGADA